jgi:adenylate cyclase
MTAGPSSEDERGERKRLHDEEMARGVLMGTNRTMRFGRHVFKAIPSEAHCKLCASPLRGAWGGVFSIVGKGPWPKNPKYCAMCFKEMVRRRSGAEIPCSLLFADVRGSTELAEQMSPTDFRGLMDRFFAAATGVLLDYDAIVDKFVGDEVIALFIPVLTGELHATRAIASGQALLAATRDWISVGAGVNTGVAFVGAIGPDDQAEFTAMGDPVNVAARLASAAGAGELLVSDAAIHAAGFDDTGLEHRRLALKGKTEVTEVAVLRAG